MPSTLFPLPLSDRQVRQELTGFADVLEAILEYTGQTEEDLFAEQIRSAQGDLERKTRIPYFRTRFVTEELAANPGPSAGSQPALVAGTDYDRLVQPLNYVVNDWQQGSGRIELPWRPVKRGDITTYRFSFSQGAIIVDLPLTWLNVNSWRGSVNILPQGVGISSTQYFRLLLLFPFYRGSASGTVIPNLIHLRYTAGLVDPSGYDDIAAENPQKETDWDQLLVAGYQKALQRLAAANIMRQLLNELDKGGASISFAGLSESVNTQMLTDRADRRERQALEWADSLAEQTAGPTYVFI